MIVAVLGEKGGTGKTTLATNLTGMRAAEGQGRDVLLVDADRQGSASYWAEKRSNRYPQLPAVQSVQKFGEGLQRTVRDMERRYDDLLIDAGDSREVESALRVADIAIIPVQPAGLDVWTLGLIDDRVGEALAVNDVLQAYVVLNRASPNPKDNDAVEAKEAIEGCAHLHLASGVICDRVAVKRAAPAGLTVMEYKPFDPKAAHELQQLYALAFAPRRS
jgi:chromosome partitioning protein